MNGFAALDIHPHRRYVVDIGGRRSCRCRLHINFAPFLHSLDFTQNLGVTHFFSHTIHDDLDSIVQDIRQAHLPDRTTADPQPSLTDVKEQFDRAMQLGSNEERVIHEFCDRMQIPFDKIASEDFSAFMRILSLSKLMKNPNNMRGKARPQLPYNGVKKKKRG